MNGQENREPAEQGTRDNDMNGQEVREPAEQGTRDNDMNGQEVREPEEQKTPRKKKKEKVKKTVGQEILSWVLTIVVAVIAALVIRSVIFEPVRVDGHSMDDTLADKEIMLVTKYDYSSTWLSFFWQSDADKENAPRFTLGGNPKRFDVVICRYPGRGSTNFVKRCVGLPGDTVEIREGYLYVNGERFEEPYINDEYRAGENTSAFYVPAKGDALSIEDNILMVNGQAWPWRLVRLAGKAENGDRLEYSFDRNASRAVLKLNGKEITDQAELDRLAGVDFRLESDYFFMMGDHRNNSNDSRRVGPIERSMIVGHVRRVLFPFNRWRGVKNGLDEAAK